MRLRSAIALGTLGTALLLVGCIHHETTVYRDEPRVGVRFENDRAARIFYETFSKAGEKQERSESRTKVEVPVVFHNERRVVSGPNHAFNRSVEICDSNHDGEITEQEAQIYAQTKHK
jgi:hypothetical protein